MSTKTITTNYLAFIFDDLTEFYATRELIDKLKRKKIPTDIIIPFDSGYNGLAKHTYTKIKDLGYNPLNDVPKNKIYKVLLTPYPELDIIQRTNFIYHIRMPYSTISAKPNPTYNIASKINYDAIICFNNYEPAFLNCYGAECYSVPYWKYSNFKKKPSKNQKPTLLILPTFGQDTSCVQYLSDTMINDIKKHFKVIIKAHHAIHFGQDGQDALKKLRDFADEFYDSDTPITELLKTADIVLSDNSGSIFESIYANTPIVAFSKDLNARSLNGIDTLQYQLMQDNILPYTNDPSKILPLLLSAKTYFKKQQNIKKKLFQETKTNSVDVTVNILKKYLNKDNTKDYRKILHDMMLEEWFKNKKDSQENPKLKAQISTLEAKVKQYEAVFDSGAYQFYDKLIAPYKKIKTMRNKHEK